MRWRLTKQQESIQINQYRIIARVKTQVRQNADQVGQILFIN